MGVDWSKRESAPQYGFLGNASYFITDFGDNVMKTMVMLGDPDMLNSKYTIHHSLNSRGDLVEFDNDLAVAFDFTRETVDDFVLHMSGRNSLSFNKSAVSHNMAITFNTHGSQMCNGAIVNTASYDGLRF